jgi:hypothetical protein
VAPSESERQQKQRSQRTSSRQELLRQEGVTNLPANPLFGVDPFEPESYAPYAPETWQKPLRSGRYIQPGYQSLAAQEQAGQIQGFYENPDQYYQDNKLNILNQQNLVERSASFLARIFDYEDEADFSLFGVDLSAVESVFDRSIRHLTGFYDLLSIGFGGLISAAPGGLRTLSYDELSAGKNVLEVLNGEMDPGEAPSPGQIALTSIGMEAARIRNGGARASDILLANPATAPFILAALAADTSMIQRADFDIMNREMREKAFGSGYEQWFSGVTDAGLQFADPLIIVGWGSKIARAGMIGAGRGSKADRAALNGLVDQAVQSIDSRKGVNSEEAATALINRETPLTQQPTIEQLVQEPFLEAGLPRITSADSADYGDDFMADFLDRVTRFDDDGIKQMDATAIEQELPVWGTDRSGEIAALFYRSGSYYEAAQLIKLLNGDRAALTKLTALQPALADEAFRLRRQLKAAQLINEPDKVTTVIKGLNETKDTLQTRLDDISDRIPTQVTAENVGEATELQRQAATLQRSLDETDELLRVAEGDIPDYLDPNSINFDPETSRKVVDGIVQRHVARNPDELADLLDGGLSNRFWFASKNNPYSRAVMASRKRRAKARYQYAVEGTSIFPHKRPKTLEDGKVVYESDGWFSKSTFEGTSRIERNLRIWRWLGEETPSGYLGLKGTATVGTEREFNAAVNLDIYKGNGIKTVINGEDVVIGGKQRRDELFVRFAESINNPNVDPLNVIKDIELAIADDIARAYGIQDGTKVGQEAMARIQSVVNKAQTNRRRTLETIQNQGYWVDADGNVHKSPWLESQLANGTYMLPLHELERIVRQETQGGVSGLRYKLSTAGSWVGDADAMFQSVWRPATLLRLSYTQRNTFEGLIRAAAYQVSLRPFTWPVVASVNGVRNSIVKRTVAVKSKAAADVIRQSDLPAAIIRSEQTAFELHALDNAQQLRTADGAVEFKVTGSDGVDTTLTQDAFAERYQRAVDSLSASDAELAATRAQYEASIKNTAFGKWREDQLKALNVEIENNKKSLDALDEAFEEVNSVIELIDNKRLSFARSRAQLVQMDGLLVSKYRALLDDPQRGLSMYRGQAGRARRIGSGTSIGPDGNYYGDAFTGPLASINRGLLSADNTQKQRLQVVADAYSSLFSEVKVRRSDIDWASGTRINEWSEGLADFIEEASASWVVRRLLMNDGDIDKTINDMLTTKEGRRWIKQISYLFGDPEVLMKQEPWQRTRMMPFADNVDLSTNDITTIDRNQTVDYLRDVQERLSYTLQRFIDPATEAPMDAFYSVLMRRVNDKAGAEGLGATVRQKGDKTVVALPETEQVAVTADEIRNIIATLPDEVTARFGAVGGSEIIQMTQSRFGTMYARVVNKLFRALGTIPEDAVVRGPFYNERFKETRNMLIRVFLEENGMEDRLTGRSLRNVLGMKKRGTIEHEAFEIPAKELNRIYMQAHRRALSDTREWLYTIERRTKLGKYGEYALPFVSAAQNSAVVAGKLLWKEPWLAPAIADLWRLPNRLGFEDEDGNLLMPMPLEGLSDWLSEHPEIPVIGGAMDSEDYIKIPKDGLNVMLPDTGFGLIPRPSPFIQVSASELMKANLFKQETPQILKDTLGEENANDFYQLLKDWVYGENQGMSAELLSYDKLMPAAYQKLLQSKKELARQYGYQYQLANHTQNLKYKGQLRDTKPTPEEIGQRATNALLFAMVGNLGIPTPQAPYPVLTRPQVGSPVQEVQAWYQEELARDPANANINMDRMFGEWALQVANTKITKNVGGANPSPETVSDIATLNPLIRDVAQTVGENNLEVLGILVNNRSSVSDYETSAYAWEKASKIPGTNREWREIQNPQQSVAEQQRIAGWTYYSREKDKLDARLAAAGYTSYEQAGAVGFKAAKTQLVNNMMANPDYAGWQTDFLDRGGSRTLAAVQTIEAAVSDDSFRKLMVSAGKEQTLSNMIAYTQYRRTLLGMLKRSGHGIEHDSNAVLKLAWANIRQQLMNSDIRWADIATRYLSSDDNPLTPGYQDIAEALEMAGTNG